MPGGRQWFSFSRYQYIREIRINPPRYWTVCRIFYGKGESGLCTIIFEINDDRQIDVYGGEKL